MTSRTDTYRRIEPHIMVMEEEMLNPAAIDEDDLAVLTFFKRKLRIARESFKEAHPDKPDE